MWGILPPIIAYSFRHLHFPPVHSPFQDRFSPTGTLPYHVNSYQPSAFSIQSFILRLPSAARCFRPGPAAFPSSPLPKEQPKEALPRTKTHPRTKIDRELLTADR